MAEVTVELGALLDKTNFELFDFVYQFDDVAFKAQIEQQLIDFYYDYEIGQETPDMFKRKFKARWNRIMPYYNKLYNTTLLTYNPLTNYSLQEVLDQLATSNNTQTTDMSTGVIAKTTNSGSNTVAQNTTSDSDSTSNTKASDYPQQPIAGGDYASGETTNTTGSLTVGTNNATTTLGAIVDVTDNTTNRGSVIDVKTDNTDYTKTIEGITGTTYPELIEKHRDALLRINDMIIEEMKNCFILVY